MGDSGIISYHNRDTIGVAVSLRGCEQMRTMGLRVRRKFGNVLDSTGSEAHRTSCFRMIHNLGANNDYQRPGGPNGPLEHIVRKSG